MSGARAATRWRGTARVIGVLPLLMAPSSRTQGQERSATTVLGTFDTRHTAAEQVALPRGLREISGLATTADGRLFGHGDESGVVAQINPRTGAIEKYFSLGSPAIRGDFEGIAIAGDRFFLITSTGQLYETREGANGVGTRYTVVDTGFGKSCEIEGLAYDSSDRTLLIGCKHMLKLSRPLRMTMFRWSVDRGAPAVPATITIDLTDVAGSTGASNVRISSVEREPRSGHYVVIAGPAWQLVELTKDGRVVAAKGLSRRLHRQPEGLTFLGDSLLLVVDEGGRGRALLTRYHRVR
jgi:uncharacterized protein YjiK